MDRLFLRFLPDADLEELIFLERITNHLSRVELEDFLFYYRSARRKSEVVLVLAALGFMGLAGVHRFVLSKPISGLFYFFTGGIFLLGTIFDLINHRNLTRRYNRKQAFQVLDMIEDYGDMRA